MDSALTRLRALNSYRVHLHQRIEMLSYRFEAQGELAWARGDRMRLHLQLTVLNDRHELLEVCDGKHWYRRLTLLHEQAETLKANVAEVRQELAKPGLPEGLGDLFMAGRLGLGGIVPLVQSLGQAFVLRVASASDRRFAQGKRQTELVGHMRSDGLRALLQLRPNQPVTLDRVPGYVPVRCRIVLDTATGWPTLVHLFGRDKKAYIDLRLSDIKVNPALADSEFVLGVGTDEQVPDQTRRLVAELAQRRAAASRPSARGATTAPSAGSR